MAGQIIVYGANGYTGRLVAEAVLAKGLTPILAGRNAQALQAVASDLGCDHVAVSVDDPAGLRALLTPATVVLHCAGPFMETSAQMVQACMDTGTHYVDITGEPPVFEACHSRGAKARAKGIMVMPGGGFDVVPTDCVSGLLKQRLPDATHLTLAFASTGGVSRGTMRTSRQFLADPTLVRLDGRLAARASNDNAQIDFGDGLRTVTPTTWGDVVTAFYSTGIPNIEVFMAMPAQAEALLNMPWLIKKFLASRLGKGIVERKLRAEPAGPNEAQRATGHALVYGHVSNAAGQSAEIRLRTAEGYHLTAESMAEIANRVLSGDAPAGYQTPAMAYGPTFVMGLPGSDLLP